MIYVASSWRNDVQPVVVEFLRKLGHAVYDFKNPEEGNNGFHWSEIGKNWQEWTFPEYKSALESPLAIDGFNMDFNAMRQSDTCVLVLPCGRSAHLEAGWFCGQPGKKLYIYKPFMTPVEPELMYKMADGMTDSLKRLGDMLKI